MKASGRTRSRQADERRLVVRQRQPVDLQGGRKDADAGDDHHRCRCRRQGHGGRCEQGQDHGADREAEAEIAPEQGTDPDLAPAGLGGDDAAQAKLAQMEGIALYCQGHGPDPHGVGREGMGQDHGRDGGETGTAGPAAGEDEETQQRTQRVPRQR